MNPLALPQRQVRQVAESIKPAAITIHSRYRYYCYSEMRARRRWRWCDTRELTRLVLWRFPNFFFLLLLFYVNGLILFAGRNFFPVLVPCTLTVNRLNNGFVKYTCNYSVNLIFIKWDIFFLLVYKWIPMTGILYC